MSRREKSINFYNNDCYVGYSIYRISLRSQQSADNLALGDCKTVELKAGVPTTVDMKFGGWSEYNYWVYIEIDNTKVEIMIDPT